MDLKTPYDAWNWQPSGILWPARRSNQHPGGLGDDELERECSGSMGGPVIWLHGSDPRSPIRRAELPGRDQLNDAFNVSDTFHKSLPSLGNVGSMAGAGELIKASEIGS